MKRLVGIFAMVVAAQIPSLGSVVYSFSSPFGFSGIGFTATLPEYLNLSPGDSQTVPAAALSSCSTGFASGGTRDFCASVTLTRMAGGGSVLISAAGISNPELAAPVAPAALFPSLTFGEAGSFAGNLEVVGTPAIFTIQAIPEPGTGALVGLLLTSVLIVTAQQRRNSRGSTSKVASVGV